MISPGRYSSVPDLTTDDALDSLMMPSGPSPRPDQQSFIAGSVTASSDQPTRPSTPPPLTQDLEPEPEPQPAIAGAAVSASTLASFGHTGVVEASGVYTGWMFKKGETGSGWKRRFFSLNLATSSLSYYDKPGGVKRATIDLTACLGVRQITLDDQRMPALELEFAKIAYQLAAEDDPARQAWRVALARALAAAQTSGATTAIAARGSGSGSAAAATWEADEDVLTCKGCSQPFSVVRRRHHCRVCGGVFCDRCAPKGAIEINNVDTGKLQKERACHECVAKKRQQVRGGAA